MKTNVEKLHVNEISLSEEATNYLLSLQENDNDLLLTEVEIIQQSIDLITCLSSDMLRGIISPVDAGEVLKLIGLLHDHKDDLLKLMKHTHED